MRNRCRYIIVLILILCSFNTVKAQGDNEAGRVVISGSWQFNKVFNNHFAKEFSGWGFNAEMGYHFGKYFTGGAFLNWHTNRTNMARQVYYYNEDIAVNTDMLYSFYQIPFGVFAHLNLITNKMLEPFIELKVGGSYAQETYYHNVFKFKETSWGLFISPELGLTVYPFKMGRLCGFKMALYYSMSNNKTIGCTDYIRNIGIRLGIVAYL